MLSGLHSHILHNHAEQTQIGHINCGTFGVSAFIEHDCSPYDYYCYYFILLLCIQNEYYKSTFVRALSNARQLKTTSDRNDAETRRIVVFGRCRAIEHTQYNMVYSLWLCDDDDRFGDGNKTYSTQIKDVIVLYIILSAYIELLMVVLRSKSFSACCHEFAIVFGQRNAAKRRAKRQSQLCQSWKIN